MWRAEYCTTRSNSPNSSTFITLEHFIRNTVGWFFIKWEWIRVEHEMRTMSTNLFMTAIERCEMAQVSETTGVYDNWSNAQTTSLLRVWSVLSLKTSTEIACNCYEVELEAFGQRLEWVLNRLECHRVQPDAQRRRQREQGADERRRRHEVPESCVSTSNKSYRDLHYILTVLYSIPIINAACVKASYERTNRLCWAKWTCSRALRGSASPAPSSVPQALTTSRTAVPSASPPRDGVLRTAPFAALQMWTPRSYRKARSRPQRPPALHLH